MATKRVEFVVLASSPSNTCWQLKKNGFKISFRGKGDIVMSVFNSVMFWIENLFSKYWFFLLLCLLGEEDRRR